jgi:hypothetical protein
VQEGEVRGLVRGYAALLKAHGLAPEKVLVLLKEFTRTSIAPHLPTRVDGVSDAGITREEIIERVVTWCIEAYYDCGEDAADASDGMPVRGAGTGPSLRTSIRQPQELHS